MILLVFDIVSNRRDLFSQSTLSVSLPPDSSAYQNAETGFYEESGDTMRAAGLHAIATVLDSEAVLIKSSVQKHPKLEPLIRLITSRIAGFVAAGRYVVCEYNVRREQLSVATAVTPGRRAPTISPLEDGDWVAVSAMVEKKRTADVRDRLVAIGAEDVLIFNLDNCRV